MDKIFSERNRNNFRKTQKLTFIKIIELQKEMMELSHTFGSRSEKIIKIINVFYENPF